MAQITTLSTNDIDNTDSALQEQKNATRTGARREVLEKRDVLLQRIQKRDDGIMSGERTFPSLQVASGIFDPTATLQHCVLKLSCLMQHQVQPFWPLGLVDSCNFYRAERSFWNRSAYKPQVIKGGVRRMFDFAMPCKVHL